MRYLIVVPTSFEAAMLAKKPKKGEYICLRDCEKCTGAKCKNSVYLCISGIAKTSVKPIESALTKENIAKIIVVGMAGNLTNENRLGQTFIIKTVTDKEDIIILKKTSQIDLNKLGHDGFTSLVTVNKPVYTKIRKQGHAVYADLVDMEGYHLAKFCTQKNIELTIIRVVSDNCETNLGGYNERTPSEQLPVFLINAQKKVAEIINTIVKQLS